MKKIIALVIVAATVWACNNNKNADDKKETTEVKGASFGAKIDDKDAVSMADMLKSMNGKGEMECKLTGKVTNVCQKKGCWMEIDKGNGTAMRVTFKDYGFFVPKDASGKTAIMHGRVYMDTTSVEALKHYAMDAGKTDAEIAKITEPELEMAFEADGVILQ